jgi:hypothetical protein
VLPCSSRRVSSIHINVCSLLKSRVVAAEETHFARAMRGFPLDRSHISGARCATPTVVRETLRAVEAGALKASHTGLDYPLTLRVSRLSTIITTTTTSTTAREPVLLAQRGGRAHLAPWLADYACPSLHNIYTTTNTKCEQHVGRTPTATTLLAPASKEERAADVGMRAGILTFTRSPLGGEFFSTWQKN